MISDRPKYAEFINLLSKICSPGGYIRGKRLSDLAELLGCSIHYIQILIEAGVAKKDIAKWHIKLNCKKAILLRVNSVHREKCLQNVSIPEKKESNKEKRLTTHLQNLETKANAQALSAHVNFPEITNSHDTPTWKPRHRFPWWLWAHWMARIKTAFARRLKREGFGREAWRIIRELYLPGLGRWLKSKPRAWIEAMIARIECYILKFWDTDANFGDDWKSVNVFTMLLKKATNDQSKPRKRKNGETDYAGARRKRAMGTVLPISELFAEADRAKNLEPRKTAL